MNKNISMVCGCDVIPLNNVISDVETLQYIKKAGFKNVCLTWMKNGWGETQEKMFTLCKKLGLNINLVHLGYTEGHDISNIWKEGPAGDNLVKK